MQDKDSEQGPEEATEIYDKGEQENSTQGLDPQTLESLAAFLSRENENPTKYQEVDEADENEFVKSLHNCHNLLGLRQLQMPLKLQ